MGALGWRGSLRPSPEGEVLVERRSWAMGQPVHLQLFAASEDAGLESAQRALTELRRVEGALSLFDDASDLSELNRHAGGRGVRVGADLATVLGAGLHFERLTGGAFNPAIEPLMQAWGFHAPREREPTAADVARAREAVAAARILLADGRARLPLRDSRVDLGGIGVGYGLDRAIGVLRGDGIRRAFLDVSGDCFALGAPPGQSGWLVSVPDPEVTGRTIASTRLRDEAIATSSNLISVVRYGQAVRGHVMDPTTGWPADRRVQATAVAHSGVAADALSTAMLVSGSPVAGVARSWLR